MMKARTHDEIGQAIRKIRLEKGLNQAQLAKMARMHQPMISAIECGHPGVRLDTLLSLLEVLGVEFQIKPRGRNNSGDASGEDGHQTMDEAA